MELTLCWKKKFNIHFSSSWNNGVNIYVLIYRLKYIYISVWLLLTPYNWFTSLISVLHISRFLPTSTVTLPHQKLPYLLLIHLMSMIKMWLHVCQHWELLITGGTSISPHLEVDYLNVGAESFFEFFAVGTVARSLGERVRVQLLGRWFWRSW